MSSTGITTSRSSGLRWPASTIVTGRSPPRKREISSSGRCVADSPIRCGSVAVIADSRSSESIRCEPRLVPATAWISSMITVSTELSTSRAPEVSIRYSDSGVVIRMSGGLRRIAARWDWGVSPLRSATATGGSAPMPASGARRLRSTSWFSARSGET